MKPEAPTPNPESPVATGPAAPPRAPRKVEVHSIHGDTREDPYAWMRRKDAPELRAHLEAENTWTAAAMEPTKPLQERLYREMVGRIKETDSSVPYREQGDYHYSRTEEGKQYTWYCRRRGRADAPEEVLLDLNALARGHDYLALGLYALSDGGRFMAYSLDTTGFREYTLRVRDLEADRLLPLSIEKVSAFAWAADGSLLYVVEDPAKRPFRLYRHELGRPGEDRLLYEETDERFRVAVWRSRSLEWLFLMVSSHTTSEVRFAPSAEPLADWRLVAPRRQDHEYDVSHRGDRFYIRTNSDAQQFRLVSAPVDDPGPESWEEVVPHRPEVMLEWVEVFRDHAVLLEREDGLPRLRVLDLETGGDHAVELPEALCSVSTGDNHEFDTDVVRIFYESPTTPPSVYDYDMRTRERTLRKRTEVVGGHDPEAYVTERLHATAPDGARIPISLVRRRTGDTESDARTLLYGYGAYGISLPLNFSSRLLSLLDRGVVFAMAHVRGGGELGKAWHDAGRMEFKENTFSDFIAAAEHLIAGRRTRPERLVIEGGSAGGLLVGAVLNRRPELFKAAVSKVPFVDVLNTMLDASLPLTVGEYEEWGNPLEEVAYRRIRGYCPYTNLAARDYPALLVRASLNDSQVMYWEPAKYVARLRELKTDDNPLLLEMNLAAGHHGASGRYDYLREVAFEYAFVLWQLGILE